jgi:hypothetical protein
MRLSAFLLTAVLTLAGYAFAQDSAQPPAGPRPERVQVTPGTAQAEVGQTLKFTATGLTADGKTIDAKPSAWFVAPFDVGAADLEGNVTVFAPGEMRVGAIINGKPGFATVTIRPQSVARIAIGQPAAPLVVGGVLGLDARAFTANGDPRTDVVLEWTSAAPSIATVEAGVVSGIAPGRAVIKAASGQTTATVQVEVTANPVTRLAIEPRTTNVRTGDVVRFSATASGAGGRPLTLAVRWGVSGVGASIGSDGGFVAEQPGSYIVTATSGDRAASAVVAVAQRRAERELEVVGRTPLEEFQTLEQWIVGNYAYATSAMSGKLWVYDVTNPAAPVKVDSLSFDARILNDISITADGKIGVLSREGASNRKNGIVFLDTSDLAHPKVLSEFTEGVTGGVHSAFIDDRHVYLTDDATGSLRVINFEDPKRPKEVARWQVERADVKSLKTPEGDPYIAGRYLHDVYVKDGLLYMGYWRDGLIILDVGKGLKGGSPNAPKLVSQLRFNYHELYGPGWLAGAHSVFRYKNYVFLGDEVFPAQFDLTSRDRIPVKGVVHVVDVSKIEQPKEAAVYEVPEGGAHNMWVEDDIMYVGYYSAGARVVDVSGELRGNLYRQGREIARLWTGDSKGYRPNQPFTWGAQPHKGLIYFNDINSGLWITRLKPAATR